MSFKDHFSGHAEDYARYRPAYPEALLDFAASAAPARHLAWDCGTGSGQVALGLAERFEAVEASDASPQQIAHAAPHPRIRYRVAPAEDSGLPAGSVDLVTAGQALHWFDVPRFWAEVRRVLVPGGVVAVWSYDECRVGPKVDEALSRLYHDLVGRYWPPERRLVETGYATIPFPFEGIEAPELRLEASWDLDRLVGYLRTWSAVRRCLAAEGRDPVERILEELAAAWGAPEAARIVRWPLRVRAGRV